MHPSWDNPTIATLRIDGERLIVETNSKQRAERVASLSRSTLGHALAKSTRTEEDASGIIQEPAARAREPGAIPSLQRPGSR